MIEKKDVFFKIGQQKKTIRCKGNIIQSLIRNFIPDISLLFFFYHNRYVNERLLGNVRI